MNIDPSQEIERLKKKIKKLECLADLRRKQKRKMREQVKRSMGGLEKVLTVYTVSNYSRRVLMDAPRNEFPVYP